MKRILSAVIIILSAALSLMADGTHVFVVDELSGYTGSAPATTIKAPDFIGTSYDVANAFTLRFSDGGSSLTGRVITTPEGNYARMYQRMYVRISPMRDVAITRVRIATVNDGTSGFADGSGNLLGRSADVYVWSGNTSSPLTLTVTAADSKAWLGVKYIEVTYSSAAAPDKPDTPDNPDTPDTPDTPETPDTPDTPAAPTLTIYPEADFISPYERVELTCDIDGAAIYYTTDGSRPTSRSRRYTSPFLLSVATGLNVRALAVTPAGLTAEASRRFYFDEVGSIADFFANAAPDLSVTINADLQLAYRSGNEAYLRAVASDAAEYMLVSGAEAYLSRVHTGDIVSSVTAIASRDGMADVALLTSRPVVVGSATPADPDTLTLRAAASAAPSTFVAVRGRITSSTISDGTSALTLDDSFITIAPSMRNVEVIATGFTGVARNGAATLRLTALERDEEPAPPVVPDDPDLHLRSLTAMAVGPGSIELFGALNSYTLTPEGAPLPLTTTIAEGDTVYAFFRPAEGAALASVVVGSTPYLPTDRRFEATPYGLMTRIAVSDSDITLIATFAASTAIEAIATDAAPTSDGAVMFDMAGRRVDSRAALAPGIYLVRRPGRQAEVRAVVRSVVH